MFDSVKFVRDLCKEKNIPISTFEKECGFSNGYLNPVKLKKIPYDRAVIMAERLGITAQEILEGPKEDECITCVERVKELCKERGISISRLEKELDFGNAYIARLKKGTFPADRLDKIAKYFDVSPEYLMYGEKEKPTPVSESGIEESREQFMKAAEEMKKAVEKINSGIIPKTDFQIIKTTCPIDGTEQVIYQVFYIVDGNRFPMPNNGCENYHLCDQCDKCRSDTMVKVMK